MRKQLAKYALPEEVLQVWEKRFGNHLLPLQSRTVREYGLLEGASVLISAPTSSGKTFCGEMGVVRAVQERKKAVFLVPLKAIAEEKYRRFADCYGHLGLKVIIGTKDHPEFNFDIENGRFDIAIMVYEKFNTLLLSNFDILSQIGTVVVDELQMLEDESRGAQLELALTKLLYSAYNPQIIALSAVLGEASTLAEWLGCRLLLEKSRPVELQRGVVADGVFAYRCHNSGELGEETCPNAEESVETLFENILREYERNNQSLVFLKSKMETVRAAMKFIEYAGLEIDNDCKSYFAKRLADEEESSLVDNLTSVLSCGIAFHNADLTVTQRMAIEEGYRAGLVRVVFATTTLATGINLPATTVFIEAQKYGRKEYTGRSELEPLSWAEYESMSGRAGRMGLVDGNNHVGRAVLFASGDLEKSILWEYYIDNHPKPLRSRLDTRSAGDIALDIFASQLAKTADDIEQVLRRSFFHFCYSRNININDETYAELIESGFLEKQSLALSVTPQGGICAMTGVSVAGADYILSGWDFLSVESDEELLYEFLRCPDAESFHLTGGVSRYPFIPERHNTDNSPLLRRLSRLRRELSRDEVRRLRLVFLFTDWMAGEPLLDIEHDYHLHLGMVENLSRQMAWLLSSAAMILKAADRHSAFPKRIEKLAFSIGTGLPYAMKEIHDHFGELLFRREYWELYRQGIETMETMMKEGNAVIGKMVSSPTRLERIKGKFESIKEERMCRSKGHFDSPHTIPQSIEIDGTPIRERYRVRINGQSINLTGKSFKYLCRLAWSRLTKDNGWLYKEDLEQGFNQARYLYRLRQEIGKDFLPGWPLYENNRSGYYRLMAPPDKISVNVETLKSNPDYEIRRIAGDLAPQVAES